MAEDPRLKSPYFRDGQFHNPVAAAKSFWSFLAMRARTTYATWPESASVQEGRIKQERVDGDDLHLTLINHSTVLIQTGGLNILTDPIYADRCSPVSWAGPRRVRPPGVKFEELPKIDIVLISHDHYDHLDLPTIRQLVIRDQPRILFGLGIGGILSSLVDEAAPAGHNVTLHELDWWQKVDLPGDASAHFVPVQHFSGRGLFNRNGTLWGGFMVEVGRRKVYFAGDTGYADHFREVKERLGNPDVALLPIGAYAPRDFMAYAHIDPAEAVRAHRDLEATTSIGIHHGTFQLTAEPLDEPVESLRAEAAKAGLLPEEFLTPKFGEVVVLKGASAVASPKVAR